MAEDQEASTSGIPDSLADMRSPSLSSADMQATHTLLSSLYSFGQQPDDDAKLSKLLRHTDHDIKGKGKITSWKMQDYAYKRDPCPYPTRARGLFTAGTERIVARAYDKFFNVDEVSWTKVWLILFVVCLANGSFTVGKLARPDGRSILPDIEVKWLPDPGCGPDTGLPAGHF